MSANIQQRPATIDARQIPEGEEQLEVLPRHFGKYMLRFEDMLYLAVRNLCPDYVPRSYDFYELSNGGLYMAPQGERLRVRVHSNGFHKLVSADGAGIVACVFVYRLMAAQTDDPVFARHLESLLAFIQEHNERDMLLAAIA